MKIIQWLANPIIQIISFCIILVGSNYFGGPYGFFIYRASKEGDAFALVGAAGIIITLISLVVSYKMRSVVQFSGLVCMIISLAMFLSDKTAVAFRDILPLLTLLLFITVMIMVTRKTFFKSV